MENSASIIHAGPHKVRSMNPQKFALWLFIVSITMIFASLTSAYIVKKADGDWLIVQFPQLFKLTSIFILISSITMHGAYLAAKKNNINLIKGFLVATGLLAVAFTVGQYFSWQELIKQDVYFVGNPAGSFIYVFTGLHVLHLAGGLIFLVVVLFKTFRYQVHSKNLNSIQMCATYWHFLGGLWLYLYLFLIANN